MAQTFYTREEAANVLGVTPTELDKMHSSNQVPGIGKGPGIKFRADDIHALAESRSAFDTSGSYSGEFSSEFGSEANALNESQAGSLDDVSSEFSASGEFEQSVETTSSSEFDLSGEVSPTQLTDPSVGSDLDIGMDSSGLGKNPSVIKMSPDDVPLSDSMDFGAPPPPSQVQKPPSSKKGSVLKLADDDALDFDAPPPPPPGSQLKGPPSKAGTKARPQSDVKLDMETGSFEFSLTVDSSGKLGEAAGPVSSPPSNIPRSFSGDKPPSDSALGEDSDVRLDFDAGAAPADDDDLINLGDKPDSDIRIDPVSEVRSKGGMLAGGDLMETEQIDLDAELREADQASMVKRPRSGGLPKTKATGPGGAPAPTMLPTTSPFELSEDDLDLGSELGASGPGTSPLGADSALGDSATGGSSAGASEFELTLAPEDEGGPRTTPNKTSPLSYGDDEDIDLGGSPSIGIGDSASHRSELSGINLQVPADSGISLEKGTTGDDSVDFELTLDEEGVSGPKTLRGKLTDSDSEFELTLDEGSSASLPKIKKSSNLGGDDQKDIFETDFDLQAAGMEGDDSQSQAMALDEQDTDLESSDFDLALEEDQSSSGDMSRDEPMELSEDGSMDSPVRTRVSSDDLSSDADVMSDDALMAGDEPAAEEEEPAPLTIPAAHADWGMYPLIMMVPCVLIMFLALLMSYELVHNMWGYHQTSKPSGLLVESFAKLFEDEKPAPGAPGGGGGAKQ